MGNGSKGGIRVEGSFGLRSLVFHTPIMTTQEIADRLVALCRKEEWETAQKELFAADAISVEPDSSPNPNKVTKGIEGILEKGRQFASIIEQVHSHEVSEPIVSPGAFACSMAIDVTMKGQGRMQMSEICVYEVKDGKIVAERFFA